MNEQEIAEILGEKMAITRPSELGWASKTIEGARLREALRIKAMRLSWSSPNSREHAEAEAEYMEILGSDHLAAAAAGVAPAAMRLLGEAWSDQASKIKEALVADK